MRSPKALRACLLYEANFVAGNVDEAFATSEVVIERTFVSPRQSAFPLETRGVLAEPTEAGLYVHAQRHLVLGAEQLQPVEQIRLGPARSARRKGVEIVAIGQHRCPLL
jgi:hypothetical protein